MNKKELLKQADSNFQRGNLTLAEKHLSDLLASYPDEEAGWILLAKVVKEPERKIQCYQRAIKINPNNTETHFALHRLSRNNRTLSQKPGNPHHQPAGVSSPKNTRPFTFLVLTAILIGFGGTTLAIAQSHPDLSVAKLIDPSTPTASASVENDFTSSMQGTISNYPQYAPLVDAMLQIAAESSQTGMEGAPERPGGEIMASDVIGMETKALLADSIPQPGSLTSIILSEEQLTSWLAMELKNVPDLPLQQTQIYLRDGQIQLWGMVQGTSASTSALLVGTVSIDEDLQPRLTLQSIQIGPQLTPDILLSQAETWFNELLQQKINAEVPGLKLMNINITSGLLTISGMR